MNIKTILEERANVVHQMRDVVKRAMSEDRPLSSEEQASYDKMDTRVTDLTHMKQANENLSKVEDSLEGVEFRNLNTTEKAETDDEVRSRIFDKYLRRGREAMLPEEIRQMETGEATKGEALITKTFSSVFWDTRDQFNVMRDLSTSFPLGATTHDIAVQSTNPTSYWVAEGASITASEPTSAAITLTPHKLAVLVKVSDELLQDSRFPLEQQLASQMGRSMGIAEEDAMVAGSASETTKPKGICQSATLGVTLGTADTITRAEVIQLYYALPRQYRETATWILADSLLREIRKIVTNDGGDGEGNTMWIGGLREGEPDTLLGRPVRSSGSPDIIGTAGGFSGGLYDTSYYVIGDRLDFNVRRLSELYAENGFQGFLATARLDGDLLLDDSGRSFKNAAS